MRPGAPSALSFRCVLLRLAAIGLALVLGACGGGGAGEEAAPAPAPTALVAMADSFGRQLTEAQFGQGDSRAAGVDGTAAEGAALADAPVTVADSNGKTASGATDAQGYYRLRIDGFVAPLVASVTRADGTVWRSFSMAAVQPRAFVTMNITPLTDKLASDVAVAAGQSGSARLTPALVGANPGALPSALQRLRDQLESQIADAGLQRSAFDPVAQAFRPDRSGMDAVLEMVQVGRDAAGVTTLALKFPLGGTVTGLGDSAGLVLANGGEALAIPANTGAGANAAAFRFAAPLLQGASYTVTITQQPAGVVCTVEAGVGRIDINSRTAVKVVCSSTTYRLGGTVAGLTGTGLSLKQGTEVLDLPAGAASFTFAQGLPATAAYNVEVASQPTGTICTVSDGAGTMPAAVVSSVKVTCRTDANTLGGTIAGLLTQGLVLTSNGQSLAVPAGASSFTFPEPIASGADFAVNVTQQSVGDSCRVVGGNGRMGSLPVRVVSVLCEPKTFSVEVVVNAFAYGLGLTFAGSEFAIPSSRFVFPQRLPFGTPYTIAISTHPVSSIVRSVIPATYRCTVPEPTGVVTGDTVVAVVCEALMTLWAEVDGLTGVGLVVGLGRGDALNLVPLGGERVYGKFPEMYRLGASYTAAILQQPGGNICTIVNPSGAFFPGPSIWDVLGPGFLRITCSPG